MHWFVLNIRTYWREICMHDHRVRDGETYMGWTSVTCWSVLWRYSGWCWCCSGRTHSWDCHHFWHKAIPATEAGKENIPVKNPDDEVSYTIQCTYVDQRSRNTYCKKLRNYFSLPIQRSPHIPKPFLKKKEGAKQIAFGNAPSSTAEKKVLDSEYRHHYFS